MVAGRGKVVRVQKDLSERAEKTWMRRLSGQPAWEQEPPVKKTIIAAPGEVLGSNTDRNSNAKFYRRWRADQGACTGSSAIQGQLLMATRDREL